MRRALGNLSAAYMLIAGIFGVALLLHSGAGAADETAPGKLGWYQRFEMRVNPPPETVMLRLDPWSHALQLTDDEEEPPAERLLILRTKPEPREIPLDDSAIVTLFGGVQALSPVPMAPPEPQSIPLDDAVPAIDVEIASLQHLGPVRIVPGGRVSPITQIGERLRTKLPRDLYANFDLFLYVSKSTKGPLAQRMYVFAKNRGPSTANDLTLLHDWPVSTGRERMEVDNNGVLTSTATPVGYFQLDPKRFYRRYTSSQWGKPMPNSMFFDWMVKGYQTGLAIHGVSDKDEVAALGSRASGGCVHLSPEASAALFGLIQREYRGMVPRFAYNKDTKTVSNNGALARDGTGGLRMAQGYKALVVIENYGGQEILSELDMDSKDTDG